jgi:UDP-N-acetylmuramyl tripeptide synthase
LYDYVNVNYLLVTNLFHDQLDRYGALDTTSKKIQEAIEKNKNLVLFVNSDDVMLQELGNGNKKIFYGFDEIIYKNNNNAEQSLNELITCSCGATLSYEKVYYDHIGKYYCENCKKKRPKPDYNAKCFIYDDYSEIVFVGGNSQASFKINLVGLYNAYNALAAISMALEFGIDADLIQQSLDTYQPMFGRAQKLLIDDKKVFVQLIKNPTGASEVLRTVNFETTKNILIAINDNYADGRDVSWLWDTDFELLKNIPNKIVVSGVRAYDMATRLKYAGVEQSKIEVNLDIADGFSSAMASTSEGEQLLIMPSYTALLEMQKYLK